MDMRLRKAPSCDDIAQKQAPKYAYALSDEPLCKKQDAQVRQMFALESKKNLFGFFAAATGK